MNYISILKKEMYDVINDINCDDFGIAYSGGVDSTLLTKICLDKYHNVTLMTIGFLDSDDIKKASLIPGAYKIPFISKIVELKELKFGIKKVMKLIDWKRLVRLEVCTFYYHLFKLAKNNGINTVLSADGLDAIFCGYDIYRRNMGKNTDLKYLIKILTKQALEDKEEINKVADNFKISYLSPFLSDEIIKIADKIPLKYKIRNGSDKIRKHIVREIALDIGIDRSIAYQSKNSMQYSSKIHEGIQKLAKRESYDNILNENQRKKSKIELFINKFQNSI